MTKNAKKPARKQAKAAKPATEKSARSERKPPPGDKNLRGWKFAAAAAAQEAADGGAEAIDAHGFEAALARPYLKRVQGSFPIPKKLTWRAVAQALWDDLGVDPVDEWAEGALYNLSPYHLRIVKDESHWLYDVRGSAETDPNPKDFAALVDGVEAVGFVMFAVSFTEERGTALIVDGRRRQRAARAVNLRRLSDAVQRAADPRATPPVLIESIPALFSQDRRRLSQIKNGGNYHRSAEDVLRQLAGIQQLEEQKMPLTAIAAMMQVTTQTLANLRSLAQLSTAARAALRAGWITVNLAYRLARELPTRQDAALAATAEVPPKARQRAVEAFLAGESPEAEVRALRAKDVKLLGRRVAENTDPELAPLRALFAVLRGDVSAVREIPLKWRDCLGLVEAPQTSERSTKSERQRQLDIDDGVPGAMRIACPQCDALATEYCLGDEPDEVEGWELHDGTRIHRTRVRAFETRPVGGGMSKASAGGRGRKGQRMASREVTDPWERAGVPKADVEELVDMDIAPEECALTCHRERRELGLRDDLPLTPIAALRRQGYLDLSDVAEWIDRMRKQALEVVCTTCTADVGEPCRDVEKPHVGRMALAERARDLRPAAVGEVAA